MKRERVKDRIRLFCLVLQNGKFRQTDRWIDRQRDRQTQTDRQKDKKTRKQKHIKDR
jgi:hypothetical protein